MLFQRKFLIRWLSAALMICLILSVNSCGNDDDDDDVITSTYVGTWERIDSSDEGAVKQVLVITASTLKMTMSMSEDGLWMDLMVVEGSYSVSGDVFMLTITRLGILNDDMTGFDYYTPDDIDWDLILEDEFDISESFEVKFVVSGNKLTIISDDNGDGIFDPIEEGETFTRK
ncbi:hypothetical protein [Ancylomarina sp.]|uniref:hypothetical protein n=1 Tax=Ancylomarina sp. TaxID=1970196 RepID=UPI003565554B